MFFKRRKKETETELYTKLETIKHRFEIVMLEVESLCAKLNRVKEQRDTLARLSSDCCDYCEYFVPCHGKDCPDHTFGQSAIDSESGRTVEYNWTCEDFNYGDCPVRERYCKECIPNGSCNFKWKD